MCANILYLTCGIHSIPCHDSFLAGDTKGLLSQGWDGRRLSKIVRILTALQPQMTALGFRATKESLQCLWI